jgi:uncharacterized membrane protein
MEPTGNAAKPPSLAAIKQARTPVRDVNAQHEESFTAMERLALYINEHVGTPGFFLIIVVWTIIWLIWNSLLPKPVRFDPYPAFVLWLFISNVLQIFLMPLLLVAQNLLSRHSELRAENDFDVNIKAEREVEAILQHLEYQNSLLIAMMEKMGLREEEIMAHLKQQAPPPEEQSTV